MACHEPVRVPTDDDPVPMTAEERTTWAYLVAVTLSTSVYLVVVVPRALAGPIDEVSWVAPMLWTIGASVLATILGTIVVLAAGAARAAARGGDARSGFTTDARDAEISRFGSWRGAGVSALVVPVVLVLAMIDADPFWIGNAAFAGGVAGAVVETVTKIRAYRRGF